MNDRAIRLAILGCGAIARRRYVPAARAMPGVQLAALVDSDLERAKAVSRAYGLDCRLASDYRSILRDVDAVVNALPNHLHAPVNLDFLNAGVHVLCEKPLTCTGDEARACCQVAEEQALVLAAAMSWRFRESSALLRLVLDEGILGSIRGYDWEYGMPYDWPTASGFYFSRAQAGGGILLDEGIHILDCLRDWFGPVTEFDYQDDNWGSGIEANAVVTLHHRGPWGDVVGSVRLSRTYALKNRLRVEGELCHALVFRDDHTTVHLRRCLAGQQVNMALHLPRNNGSEPQDPFRAELKDFVESVKETRKPAVDGSRALEIIELIEGCYAKARRLPEPWAEQPSPVGVAR